MVRATRPGVIAEPDSSYPQFVDRFPYEETDDQQAAIDVVLSELASGRPMDRLICGDVGFGKTEIALRAAFVTVMQGRQVAVVVPTTLLARQHTGTFTERFRGFPVQIAQAWADICLPAARSARTTPVTRHCVVLFGNEAVIADLEG